MKFYFISKACKGHEYLYKREFVTKCRSMKQAEKMAELLNNSKKDVGIFNLQSNEIWHAYTDDDNFIAPYFRITTSKNGRVSIKRIAY